MAAKDMTNQQLLKAIRTELKGFVTKDDLKEELKKLATKVDLEQAVERLEQKIDGNQQANIKHHLETRKAIGELNKDFTTMREGLAQAAGF